MDLQVGERAKILGFNSVNKLYLQKLLSMGLIPNTEFTVIRVAPLGDPVELRVHHFSVCIRKQEAEVLQLERIIENKEKSQ